MKSHRCISSIRTVALTESSMFDIQINSKLRRYLFKSKPAVMYGGMLTCICSFHMFTCLISQPWVRTCPKLDTPEPQLPALFRQQPPFFHLQSWRD